MNKQIFEKDPGECQNPADLGSLRNDLGTWNHGPRRGAQLKHCVSCDSANRDLRNGFADFLISSNLSAMPIPEDLINAHRIHV